MKEEMIVHGLWKIPTKVKNCLCPDGKRRTVKITGQATTYFSIPASVKYKGKSISGFITGRETEKLEKDFEFIPYSYGKNGHLFSESK